MDSKNTIAPNTVEQDETNENDGIELEELRLDQLKQVAGGGEPSAWG
jgi:hypothetical protein